MALPDNELISTDIVEMTAYTYDPTTQQEGLNVSYWKVASILGIVTDTDVVGHFDTDLNVLYKAAMAPDVEYYGIKVSLVNRVFPPLPKIVAVNSGPGTYPVEGALTDAGQNAALSTFFANVRGPKGRARKYWPFLPTDAYDENNQLTPAYVGIIEALTLYYKATQLVAPIPLTNQAQLVPIIVHRPIPAPGGTWSWDVIHEGVTQEWVATQRRRGHYGRTNTLPVPNINA